MSKLRFFGSVRFTAEAGLNPSDLHDHVLRIEGGISGGLGEEASFVGEEAEDVGLVEAYLVQTARLDAEGGPGRRLRRPLRPARGGLRRPVR